VQKAEVELAEQFMKQLTGEFHPEKFKDEYEGRVEQLIESKQGQAEAPSKQPKRKLAPVIDLMEALRKSMGQGSAADEEDESKKPPQRAAGQRKRREG
jgi:DNA end-binding protein Ku